MVRLTVSCLSPAWVPPPSPRSTHFIPESRGVRAEPSFEAQERLGGREKLRVPQGRWEKGAGWTSREEEPRHAAGGAAAPGVRAELESQVSAPGVRLRAASYFLCLQGRRPSPPAANPKEVTAGAAKGGPGRLGGEGPDSAGHF